MYVGSQGSLSDRLASFPCFHFVCFICRWARHMWSPLLATLPPPFLLGTSAFLEESTALSAVWRKSQHTCNHACPTQEYDGATATWKVFQCAAYCSIKWQRRASLPSLIMLSTPRPSSPTPANPAVVAFHATSVSLMWCKYGRFRHFRRLLGTVPRWLAGERLTGR